MKTKRALLSFYIIIGLIFASFLIVDIEDGWGIQKADGTDDPIVEGTGTITYITCEGGFYGIIGDDGEHYDPINMPPEFEFNGFRVKFKGHIRFGVSIHMWGDLLELTSIEKIDEDDKEYVKIQGIVSDYPAFPSWLGRDGINVVISKIIVDSRGTLEIGDMVTVTKRYDQEPFILSMGVGYRIEATGEYGDITEIPGNVTNLGEHLLSPTRITWVYGLPQNQSLTTHFEYTPESPVTVDASIDFMDNSTDSNGNIVSWIWNFGDGSSAQGNNVTHTYTEEDIYTVILTIIDDSGETDKFTSVITVEQDDDSFIPGFGISLLVIAFIGLLMIKRKR